MGDRMLLAVVVPVLLTTGCTMKAGEITTLESGVYQCRARSPGYEDLPVYVFDMETADPKARIGIGAPTSITMTTVEGGRVTITDAVPPGYYCMKIAALPTEDSGGGDGS